MFGNGVMSYGGRRPPTPPFGQCGKKKSTWEVFLDSVSAGIELLGQLKIFSLTSSHKEILPELPVGPDSVV